MLLAAIVSVSLIVGGIGTMNIMLVSVSERHGGNRASPSRRREDPRHLGLIPGGGRYVIDRGWRDWHCARDYRQCSHFLFCGLVYGG